MSQSYIREIIRPPKKEKMGKFARLPPLCDLLGSSFEGTLAVGRFGDSDACLRRDLCELIGAEVSLRTLGTLHDCGEDAADRWLAGMERMGKLPKI